MTRLNARTLLLFAAIAVSLSALAYVWKTRAAAAQAQLPPLRAYANLPPAFNEALGAAYPTLRDPRRDRAPVQRLARLYQANRLNDEARTCYALLAHTPEGLDAHDDYLLAQLSLDAGDLAGAQKHLTSVVAKDPSYLPARLVLADVLFKTGAEDAAAHEYEAILAQEPQNPGAALGLARLDLQRGQEDRAVDRLEKLLAAHPESASVTALLAQISGRRGDSERAVALTQRSKQLHDPVPSDPWLDALWADCYDKQRLALKFEEYFVAGQLDDASPLLARLDQVDPENWIPPMLRGWSEARTGHVDAAVREYRTALSRGGDPERVCPLLAAALASRPAEAEAAMAEFHAKKPDSIPILTAYADAAARAHDDRTALALLRRLVAQEPYLYSANLSLARLLWNTPEREEAVACLLRIVKVFPVDIASRGLLGQHYLENARPDAAIPVLEQALPTAGENSAAREKLRAMLHQAYRQVAAREAGAGRIDAAAGWYAKAVKLGPGDPDTLAAWASISVQRQDFGAAADALRRLAELEPANPTIPLSLGDVLYQAGEKAAANTQWLRARTLAPATDKELRAALEQRLSGHITAETFR